MPDGDGVTITLDGVAEIATVIGGAFSADFDTSALLTTSGSPYTISYSYAGDTDLAAVSNTSQKLTVAKAAPILSGLSSPTITVGASSTTLSGDISLVPDGESVSITLNGKTQTASVSSGSFSSSFNTSALTAAGSPYKITYSYAGDANLSAASDTSRSVTVTNLAVPVFSGLSGATITYGTATTVLSGSISRVPNGETVAVTLGGVTQTATVTGGTFSSSFDTSTLGVAGSPYAITYSYAGDATLAAVSDSSQSVTVSQAAPALTGLSGPTIAYGTAATTLSGAISMVPDGETVSITLDGVTKNATVTGGTFSANFDTSALTVDNSPYTITYNYAGDANLQGTSDTSQALTVTKLSIPAFSGLSGPTIAYGTATTTLSGSIPLVPDGETVSISLDGATQPATVIGGTSPPLSMRPVWMCPTRPTWLRTFIRATRTSRR